MKKLALFALVVAMVMAAASSSFAISGTAIALKNGWAMDYQTAVSLMRLEKVPDGIIARPAAGFGAGITIYYANALGTVISFNAPEFILTTRADDKDILDVLIGGDIGVMGNKVRIGGGYLHNRWVGLISLGL